MNSRAVFLDRDGTINEDVGYPANAGDLILLPGSAGAIRALNQQGLKVIVISNQSGIGRGLFGHAEVDNLNLDLNERLKAQGAWIDAFYYCPHAPAADGEPVCDCRKPGTGLFDRAADELAIELRLSFMVGDKLSDISAGASCGCRTVLLGNDELFETAPRYRPDCRVPGLTAAVEWILSQIGKKPD